MENGSINVLIVEDEALVALDLSMGLEKDGYNVVGIADNAEDAAELFRENEVDIVLMDINIIGEKDGVDTSIELLKQKQVPIIYLTAFTDSVTVERVKQTHPAAFLTKPYNINNVRIAIELALSNFAVAQQQGAAKVVPMDRAAAAEEASLDKDTILHMDDFIFVKHNYRFVKIKLADLLYAEADNNYIHLVTSDKKFTLRISLNAFLDKVRYGKLIRIHRSFAVNRDAIHSFNDQQVMLDRFELPIGRNYREDFLKHFHFR